MTLQVSKKLLLEGAHYELMDSHLRGNVEHVISERTHKPICLKVLLKVLDMSVASLLLIWLFWS